MTDKEILAEKAREKMIDISESEYKEFREMEMMK